METKIEIARPPAEVAAYASDPDRAPEWYRRIRSVQWESPPPLAVGSRLAFVARFLGRPLSYTYEVTELVPAARFVMKTAEGPFPMETTYTWEELPDGSTRMTLRNQGEPARFSNLSARLISRSIRRANEADLRTLKEILERDSHGRPPIRR